MRKYLFTVIATVFPTATSAAWSIHCREPGGVQLGCLAPFAYCEGPIYNVKKSPQSYYAGLEDDCRNYWKCGCRLS